MLQVTAILWFKLQGSAWQTRLVRGKGWFILFVTTKTQRREESQRVHYNG